MRKVAVILLVLCCVIAACGRKAPPVPPHLVIPRVNDLKAVASASHIVLNWTAPDQKSDVARTRVLKSALQVEKGDCPGCPRSYQVLAELHPADIKPEKGVAKFTDYNVKNGLLYTYKIVLCDSAGLCGDESNTAEMRIGAAQ